MDKLAYSVTEMAKVLSIGRNAAYELANRKDFYPAIRIGAKNIRISVEGLKRWIDERTQDDR